jgi:hypothetical protein
MGGYVLVLERAAKVNKRLLAEEVEHWMRQEEAWCVLEYQKSRTCLTKQEHYAVVTRMLESPELSDPDLLRAALKKGHRIRYDILDAYLLSVGA